MKRRIIWVSLAVILAIGALLPWALPVFASHLFENYDGGGVSSGVTVYGATWRAQTFTPSAAHTITSVTLELRRVGSPGTVQVSIRATDGSGHPTGGDLCLGYTNGNTLPTDYPYEEREISLGSGYSLNASTKYAIVVRAAGGGGGNYVLMNVDSTSPTYAGGCREDSADSGSSWSTDTTDDFHFWEYGCCVAPDITTNAASNVAKTTARLNSVVVDDGGEACEVRWGWGETSQSTITAYDNYTSFSGSYETGEYPYYDVSSLSASTLYYFRVEIQNSEDTELGGELSFTTESAISDTTDFYGVPSSTAIQLSWTRGDGASQVLVRYRLDTFPTSTSDGTLVYLGALGSYNHTGLTAGLTYYYAAWGESGGSYSSGSAEIAVTTLGTSPIDTDADITPTLPETFFQEPSYSGFSTLEPIPMIVNIFATSWGMPLNNMWFALTMFFIIGITMWILVKHRSLLGAAAFAFVALVIAVLVGLIPSWMILVPATVAVGAWAVWRLKPTA